MGRVSVVRARRWLLLPALAAIYTYFYPAFICVFCALLLLECLPIFVLNWIVVCMMGFIIPGDGIITHLAINICTFLCTSVHMYIFGYTTGISCSFHTYICMHSFCDKFLSKFQA